MDHPQKLYNEIADWWPLLSSPEEYEEEARIYASIFKKYRPNAKTMLELGSGGGNNALYLKKHWEMTLCDLAEGMLEVSRELNPECAHIQGDMRDVRIDQKFDLIFIHDAIMFMTSREDLLKVFETAKAYLNDGGFLLMMPDTVKENFEPETESGGHDREDGKSMRYLEWTRDKDPNDDIIEVDYLYILDDNGKKEVLHDYCEFGSFSKAVWQELLEQSGFDVSFEEIEYSDEPGTYYAIAAELS